ncbi:CidA/LrgA family protein [Methanosarcina hadiensis]|uniref:CidA/LrgA family protein n=1 Tax=Methanosarcina hadiensis TaxID=3078083 RepID=UPI0039776696
MLKQFSVILCIYFLGELLQKMFELPVPGNILGMLILFFFLLSGIIKLEMIDRISRFLLENLAFFFLPAGVSLITCFSVLEGKWTAILGVSIISTVVVLSVTGLTVEFVKKLTQKKPVPSESIETVLSGERKSMSKRSQKEIRIYERVKSLERKTEEEN